MSINAFEPCWNNLHIQGPRILVLRLKPRGLHQVPELVIVERDEHERHDDDGKLREAKIILRYQVIGSRLLPIAGSGYFVANYWKDFSGTEYVSLTGGNSPDVDDGAVLIQQSLRQRGLGTYMMDTVVAWAMQWPQARIPSIQLGYEYDGNIECRNRFYEQFNIQFHYTDENRRNGYSVPMSAGELIRPITGWREKIDEVLMDRLLSDYVALQMDNVDLLRRNRQQAQWLSEHFESPFKFAMQGMWQKLKRVVV